MKSYFRKNAKNQSSIEQKLIEKGLEDLRLNKLTAHSEVKKSIRKRIERMKWAQQNDCSN